MPAKKVNPNLFTLNDLQKRFLTEESCHAFVAQERWGDKPVCVHCGCDRKIYVLNGGKLFKCADCGKKFSVRIGTIFEDSPLPLQKWFHAMYVVTAHKKGIASTQLAKDIGITQKSAWHMLHRIRYAMGSKEFHQPLDGIVEADETYIGGKKKGGKRGRGSENKTPVFGMLDRDDKTVKTQPVKYVNANTLQGIIKANVAPESTIMTDEWGAYNGLDKSFAGHERVNHGEQEYARGEVHVNGMENFWSLLKRGIVGIYHQVTSKHLHRYCGEFDYRYNSRDEKDCDRFTSTFGNIEGRLTYKELIKAA